jgi:hypothetical protein
VTPFRAGDLIAKISNGLASQPVRVQRITSASKTLTLSGAITGLATNDMIVAASFPMRATVLAVTGTAVTLVGATVFPKDSHVARIDDLMKASRPAAVVSASGTALTLDVAIDGLAAGDVLGLCAFPPTVQIQSTGDTIVISQGGVISPGDVVAARKCLAVVATAKDAAIQLATPIPGLAAGDTLAVATIGGVVTATPTANPHNVSVDQPSRLRKGDFLSDIAGWRQAATFASAVARVTAVDGTGTQITLARLSDGSPYLLDGLFKNDTVGLATFAPQPPALLQLRTKTDPGVTPGDNVLIMGLDRLTGVNQSVAADVLRAPQKDNIVLLQVHASQGAFSLRPEEIFASVLFVRGSALALIQKYNLFVSWLACGEPDSSPKVCVGATVPDCPCAQSKEQP